MNTYTAQEAREALDNLDDYARMAGIDAAGPRGVLEDFIAQHESAECPSDADGWKVVPVEPTEAMIDAGTSEHECSQGDPYYSSPQLSDEDARAIYGAMLAAAPSPEVKS